MAYMFEIEYLLWYKDDDLGWHITKSSNKLDDFCDEDKWYFNQLIEGNDEVLRVGGIRYELNYRKMLAKEWSWDNVSRCDVC